MQIDPRLSLAHQLKALRAAQGVSQVALAERTGLTRVTVAAAEGKSDPRLSSIAALFGALGYELVPVPKAILRDVVAFVNNGGVTTSLPAGVEAPLSVSQRALRDAAADQAKPIDDSAGEVS